MIAFAEIVDRILQAGQWRLEIDNQKVACHRNKRNAKDSKLAKIS